MVAVPFSEPAKKSPTTPDAVESEAMNWIAFAAGGTLVASGLLLLAGERRAGMVAAASGTALALLDQQETLHHWWETLPGYIDQVQNVLNKVQDTVNDVAAKREDLRRILAR
jgi:ABC-type transporter Mla subunit MlaD